MSRTKADSKPQPKSRPRKSAQPRLFSEDDSAAPRITLLKSELLEVLAVAASEQEPEALKRVIAELKSKVQRKPAFVSGRDEEPSDTISFRQDVLLSELDQILEAQTFERARYYLKRLNRGAGSSRNGRMNEINLLRWKEYPEIITDSLWVFPKRDASGAHLGWYWGNFVPQIPRQMITRYTKKGDWVLDPFAGSGTTLIECRRLGRNGIGVELNEDVVERARDLIEAEPNRMSMASDLVTGDARTIDFGKLLADRGAKKAGLVVLHPPYADIINFSDDERDLSVATTTEAFLKMFGEVVDNVTPCLEKGRYCALVVGDKYSKGEWIPLGFYCMEEMRKRGYLLKSIVVKNFEETRAKRDQKQLWRYRALVGGFYVFKHEYVFILRKK